MIKYYDSKKKGVTKIIYDFYMNTMMELNNK